MGFRFRKSINLGPIKMTLSKSGVSTSVGVKGARVTKRADGNVQTTVSVPGTGFSHVSVEKVEPAPQPKQECEKGAAPQKTAADKVWEEHLAFQQRMEEQAAKRPFTSTSFPVRGLRSQREDGVDPQDILYRYKMRKPPFDEGCEISLAEREEGKHKEIDLLLNGMAIGKIPPKQRADVFALWDRIDGVASLEVTGRKGEYDGIVHIRHLKPGKTWEDVSE